MLSFWSPYFDVYQSEETLKKGVAFFATKGTCYLQAQGAFPFPYNLRHFPANAGSRSKIWGTAKTFK